MALKVIKASGDAYSVGRAIGSAIADTVHQVTVQNEEFIAAESLWAGSHYLEQLLAASRKVFPQYVRELEGMSDGMGVAFERIFLWNCRGDLRWPDGISPAVAAGLTEGCTSLIIPPKSGKPATIAHNEDGSDDYHGHCFWVSADTDEGPGFESFLYPGMMPGHSMGASRAGIVQTINNIRVHDLKPGVPRHFICRAILDCTSMSAALDLVSRGDRASGFHHNLGSAREGRMVSVEAPASGCNIQEIADKPSAHTNHLITPDLKDCDQEVTHSSSVRQVRADKLLFEGALNNGDPMRVLFDAEPGHEILRTPKDGGDDYGKTLATGVFEMEQHRLSITVHDGPNAAPIYSTELKF